MKSKRILGLALVAVFAFAAMTAASASASKPVWKFCQKAAVKGTGEFSDKLCSVAAPGTGSYNLVAGIGKGKGFKGKGATAILHNVIPEKGDIKVECASFKDAGSVSAPSGVFNVTSTFKKCKSLGAPCKTEGGKKETIETNKLAGSLGYLTSAKNSAGESLTSEAAPGSGYLATFECEGLAKVRVHGAVIGSLAPFGAISKASTSTFSVANWLGELKPGYKPLTNQPGFEFTGTKFEEPVGVLLTELNGPETGTTWQPEGGLPSGQEGVAENKGEALEVN
ncbi:MAG: hypothetical protein JWM60_1004 [Solirubrobacterales bacterium]|nr:hypothetical protein [Solirubrobacterales bacterium]